MLGLGFRVAELDDCSHQYVDEISEKASVQKVIFWRGPLHPVG